MKKLRKNVYNERILHPLLSYILVHIWLELTGEGGWNRKNVITTLYELPSSLAVFPLPPKIRLLPPTTRTFTTVVSSLLISQKYNYSWGVAAVRILSATTRDFTDSCPPNLSAINTTRSEHGWRTLLYVPINLKSVFKTFHRQLHTWT